METKTVKETLSYLGQPIEIKGLIEKLLRKGAGGEGTPIRPYRPKHIFYLFQSGTDVAITAHLIVPYDDFMIAFSFDEEKMANEQQRYGLRSTILEDCSLRAIQVLPDRPLGWKDFEDYALTAELGA